MKASVPRISRSFKSSPERRAYYAASNLNADFIKARLKLEFSKSRYKRRRAPMIQMLAARVAQSYFDDERRAFNLRPKFYPSGCRARRRHGGAGAGLCCGDVDLKLRLDGQ